MHAVVRLVGGMSALGRPHTAAGRRDHASKAKTETAGKRNQTRGSQNAVFGGAGLGFDAEGEVGWHQCVGRVGGGQRRV